MAGTSYSTFMGIRRSLRSEQRRDTSSDATKDFTCKQPLSLAVSGAGVSHADGTGMDQTSSTPVVEFLNQSS